MPDDPIDISTLLRLKRYEQPPPGYYDELLKNIHRRQRAELLSRPLWKIGIERVQTFFGAHSMGGLSYAGAMAALVILGVAGIGLMTPGTIHSDAVGARVAAQPSSTALDTRLSLQDQPLTLTPAESPKLRPTSVKTDQPARPPRYIIDARPVSYDRPPSL